MGKRFFDFDQFFQGGYHWPKTISSKGISLATLGVRHTSMPLQNDQKSPHVWPRERVLPQRTGMEYKRNVITPTITHLSTLQKLKKPLR